jgi:hypothetical protein
MFTCHVARYAWSIVACVLDKDITPGNMGEICGWIYEFRDSDFFNVVASGVAAVLWSMWKIRNRAKFDKVYPVDPNSIMYRIVLILCINFFYR